MIIVAEQIKWSKFLRKPICYFPKMTITLINFLSLNFFSNIVKTKELPKDIRDKTVGTRMSMTTRPSRSWQQLEQIFIIKMIINRRQPGAPDRILTHIVKIIIEKIGIDLRPSVNDPMAVWSWPNPSWGGTQAWWPVTTNILALCSAAEFLLQSS